MVSESTPFTLFEPYEIHATKRTVRKRNLRFDMNALADFEQEAGMGFGQLMATKAMFATARAMLWAGLKHEDRTLTIQKVGELMSQFIRDPDGDKNTIDKLLTICFEAASEQGAFGDQLKLEDGYGAPDTGNAHAIDVTPKKIEGLSEDPPTGQSGSPESKISPTEN